MGRSKRMSWAKGSADAGSHLSSHVPHGLCAEAGSADRLPPALLCTQVFKTLKMTILELQRGQHHLPKQGSSPGTPYGLC